MLTQDKARRDLDEIARFVGIPGEAMARFIGAAEQAGYAFARSSVGAIQNPEHRRSAPVAESPCHGQEAVEAGVATSRGAAVPASAPRPEDRRSGLSINDREDFDRLRSLLVHNPEKTALQVLELWKGGAACSAEAPAHTDHPLRHFDRTCPACVEPVTEKEWAALGRAYAAAEKAGEANDELRKRLGLAPSAIGAIPPGWLLVPVEPTKHMDATGCNEDERYSNNRFTYPSESRAYNVWRAMIDAAPEAPSSVARSEAEKAIEEHNLGCESACSAQRSEVSGAKGCGYQKHDGSLIYAHRRCPNCPLDWKIEWPLSASTRI